MIQYRKVLSLWLSGVSQRTIASSTGHSRQKVSEIIKRFKKHGLIELDEKMDNIWLEEFLFPEKQAIEKGYYPPNWERIHKELSRKNMTLQLLHYEYEEEARESAKIPYSYRSFCRKYRQYAQKYHLTMPIRRKPGEMMEVDWAGSTLFISDRGTGERLPAYIFVATLPYSQYSYVEAFLDMKSTSWLTAHIHAFEYFGAVPETIIPDNLKTGVTKAQKEETILNEAYRELGDYYGTVILPSRVRKPKDKASVEGTVGFISRQILAFLRNYQCFDIHLLNQKIHEKLEEINQASFQKKPGSRKKVFEEEEKSHLHRLPQTRFKLSEWRIAKVALNYHIQVDRMYYSVPYEYIQSEVDVRLTKDVIEVYFKETRIASHKRKYGEIGQFSTKKAHMPEHHQLYLEHTPDNLIHWAETIGNYSTQFVRFIIDGNVEKKALQMLLPLKKLAKTYGKEELEIACQTLMTISTSPSLRVLKSILSKNKEKAETKGEISPKQISEDFGFTRGAEYFGGQ